VLLNRLEEGIEYAKRHFGVYPFWNCPVGRAQRGPYTADSELEMLFANNQRNTRANERRERYLVDLGLYGEPTVPGFRSRQAIRALQNWVDVPAMWGVCYLSKQEFEALWDIRTYAALRDKYHAAAAFPHLEDKVLNRAAKDAADDPPPSPLWRVSAFYHHLKGMYRGRAR